MKHRVDIFYDYQNWVQCTDFKQNKTLNPI